MRGVLIVVPLYRNAELVAPLFRSLVASAADVKAIDARLLLIVDSPDDAPLLQVLETELPALKASMPTELHVNRENLGFIGSMNFAFEKAVAEKRDVIMLNSDVVVFPGAFSEIRDVAYLDHMIGFVSPRSNNATIFSLPYDPDLRHRSVETSYHSFKILSRHLPRFRYAPTAVGFCMYVKWTMLAEFGGFDPIYQRGYSEENDLVMRANRCGYRAAMANHAFVYHIGEKSFALTEATQQTREQRNYKILLDRYPEYERAILRENESAEAAAERQLAALLPDASGRLTIAFDWKNIGLYHNGTFEVARQLVRTAARRWAGRYNIVVIASPAAAKFHEIDEIPGIRIVSQHDPDGYAALIRVGQPFDDKIVDALCGHAPIVGAYMLDTIALDCQGLDTDGLQGIWQDAFDKLDLAVYISEYTRTQFRSRFRIAETTVEVASLLSLDYRDYASPAAAPEGAGAVLVIGNHFPHKHLDATLQKVIALYPDAKVDVLGTTQVRTPNVRVFETGSLGDADVAALYRGARVVLFPSHYEGFGLPIMHALAHRRPIVVRAMPVNTEIGQALNSSNIHARETTEEMVRLAFGGDLCWHDEPPAAATEQGWDRVVDDLESGVSEALRRLDYGRLVARLERIKQAQEKPKAGSGLFGAARRLGSPLAISFAALVSAIVMASALLLGIRGYSALPFWDQWQYVDSSELVRKLFEFHNEHRALVSKGMFLIDQLVFSGRNAFLFVMIYLIQAAHAVVLFALAIRAGVGGPVRPALLFATVVCAMLGTQNFENLTWGFQTQFVLVFAAASAALLAFSAYLEKGRRIFLGLTLLAASVATLEMANGIVIWPLLILQAYYCRAPLRAKLLVIAFTLAALFSFAYGRMVLQSDPMAVRSHPLLVLQYAFVYLGGYPGQTLWSLVGSSVFGGSQAARVQVYFVCGLGLSIAWVAALARLRGRLVARSPWLVGLAGVFLFAAGTALTTAVGRAALGIESAFASRYAIGSALALVSTVGVILIAVPLERRTIFRVAVQAGLAALVILAVAVQPAYVGIADSRREGLERAAAALATGVRDESALKFAFIDPDLVLRGSEYLRQHARSIYADERTSLLGTRVEAAAEQCLLPIARSEAVGGGTRLQGTTRANPFRLRPARVVVIDQAGTVVGLGAIELKLNARQLTDRAAEWDAYVRPGVSGPLRAVRSSGGCAVRKA